MVIVWSINWAKTIWTTISVDSANSTMLMVSAGIFWISDSRSHRLIIFKEHSSLPCNASIWLRVIPTLAAWILVFSKKPQTQCHKSQIHHSCKFNSDRNSYLLSIAWLYCLKLSHCVETKSRWESTCMIVLLTNQNLYKTEKKSVISGDFETWTSKFIVYYSWKCDSEWFNCQCATVKKLQRIL